jgi:8-oxo-dGTP pyrophosphatase MutT (NUDIX family)
MNDTRLTGIGVIVENYDGTLLLHLRDGNAPVMKNEWCLIGGGLEGGETGEAAALREVKEETGLTLNDVHFLKEFSFNGSTKGLYYGTVDTRVETLILGEGEELRFFTRYEALGHIRLLGYTNAYLENFSEYLLARPGA